MYCTPTETRKARKEHVCTYCGEAIEKGATYVLWTSFGDGGAYNNKMHPECLGVLQGESDGNGFEYVPYENERPA